MNWSSRYETIAEIGSGGMATVWVGRVRGGSEQLVALKRAHPHVRADSRAYDAMIREANLAARVRHPNVVGVLDVDQVDGDLVIVLDYVEGCTLRLLSNRLDEQRVLRPREMVRVILDIAAGLHAAHQVGLIHRDISPSNIIVGSDGMSRLADFGIAKAQFESSDGERTATGILKGKLAYMAPEYLMYQRIDALSDLFSLAVVAWESLTGRRLFKGDSDLETLAKIADADIRPISKEVRELAGFDHVFARALAKVPEDRHGSVEEFAYELETVARSFDLVASHDDVAGLIELIAEPELRARRVLVEPEPETRIARVSRSSLPPPVSRPPPRTSHPPASHPHPISMTVPAVEPSGDLPTMVQTSRHAATVMPMPAPTTRQRKNTLSEDTSREKLALVGALLLLALALGWMWTQLNQEPPRTRYSWTDGGASPTSPAMTAQPRIAPVSPAPTERGNPPRRNGR